MRFTSLVPVVVALSLSALSSVGCAAGSEPEDGETPSSDVAQNFGSPSTKEIAKEGREDRSLASLRGDRRIPSINENPQVDLAELERPVPSHDNAGQRPRRPTDIGLTTAPNVVLHDAHTHHPATAGDETSFGVDGNPNP